MNLFDKTENQPWYSIGSKEIFEILKTSEGGLLEKEIISRRQRYGPNVIDGKKQKTAWSIFLSQFKSPLIFILVIAAVIALFLKEFSDAIVIIMAITVNTLLGFYQEYKAEKSLDKLKEYLQEKIRVIRHGQEIEIDVKELVVGDMVHIVSGNRIPADLRIIKEKNLNIDESILTGESLPVKKHSSVISGLVPVSERKNMLFGGTLAVQGDGLAVVTEVGADSEFGKIAELVGTASETKTPLQKSIGKFAWLLTFILGLLVAVIFLNGIRSGQPAVDMFFIAVALAVGAIPEGLPIALTAVFAVGVERLAKKNGVVRKLIAAEALGSASVIITDKTGTLTQGVMKLAQIIPIENISNISISLNKKTGFSKEQKKLASLALMGIQVLVTEVDKKFIYSGRPLEVSLANECALRGVKLENIRKNSVTQEIDSFNPSRRFSIHEIISMNRDLDILSLRSKEKILLLFGAPEVLISKSKLKSDQKQILLQKINEMANSGELILAVAYKKVSLSGKISVNEYKNFSLGGFISFSDPIRPEAVEALNRIKMAGVKTIIATGDHKGTAMALARQLGWQVSDEKVIDGIEFDNMSEEDLKSRLPNINIFARVNPEQKLKIVKLYKSLGESVAMTGDGVNDAPSLKEADIGIAVGSGTDVAKSVADLVLLDNNIKTIVLAIEEGRHIMGNIKKTIVYLLANVLDGILIVGSAILGDWPLPLLATQILWINFFTDSFPAVAFAFEREQENIKESPKNIKKVFDSEVKTLLAGVGLGTSLILCLVYVILQNIGVNIDTLRTFIFASLGLYTLVVAFSLRNFKMPIWSYNIFSNKYMVVGVGLGVIMMILGIYFPPLQQLLKTQSLSWQWMIGVVGMVAVNVAVAEIIKKFFRK